MPRQVCPGGAIQDIFLVCWSGWGNSSYLSQMPRSCHVETFQIERQKENILGDNCFTFWWTIFLSVWRKMELNNFVCGEKGWIYQVSDEVQINNTTWTVFTCDNMQFVLGTSVCVCVLYNTVCNTFLNLPNSQIYLFVCWCWICRFTARNLN